MIKQLMIELTRNRQEHQFHSIEEALTDCFRHDEMKKSYMDISGYLLKTKSSSLQYQWYDKNNNSIKIKSFILFYVILKLFKFLSCQIWNLKTC